VLWLIVLTHYFNFWGKMIDKLKLNDGLAFNTHDVKDDTLNIKIPYVVFKKRQKLEE
jgi:hypothetical protein